MNTPTYPIKAMDVIRLAHAIESWYATDFSSAVVLAVVEARLSRLRG